MRRLLTAIVALVVAVSGTAPAAARDGEDLISAHGHIFAFFDGEPISSGDTIVVRASSTASGVTGSFVVAAHVTGVSRYAPTNVVCATAIGGLGVVAAVPKHPIPEVGEPVYIVWVRDNGDEGDGVQVDGSDLSSLRGFGVELEDVCDWYAGMILFHNMTPLYLLSGNVSVQDGR